MNIQLIISILGLVFMPVAGYLLTYSITFGYWYEIIIFSILFGVSATMVVLPHNITECDCHLCYEEPLETVIIGNTLEVDGKKYIITEIKENVK